MTDPPRRIPTSLNTDLGDFLEHSIYTLPYHYNPSFRRRVPQDLDIGAVDAGVVDGAVNPFSDAAADVGQADAGPSPDAGCTVCDAPPTAVCVGDSRRTFVGGRCVSGSCEYDSVDTACSDGCVDGECGESPCAGVMCDEEPPSTCVDANTLRVFDLGGACEDGDCTYGSRELPCEHGCEAGACLADLCEGVTCDSPPSMCHESAGSCVEGACEYALRPATAVCDDGEACTVGDRCGTGICGGTALRCDAPPSADCVDGSILREFSPVGVCGAGECTYTSSERSCEFGCSAGSCVMDPCEGVSCAMPPSPTACYASTGACMGGECAYMPIDDVGCDDGDPCTVSDVCGSGSCAGTPLTCDTPPPSTCADSTTRRSFGTGMCNAGACEYAAMDVACEAGEICRLATCVDRCAIQGPVETLAISRDIFAPSVAYDAAGDRTLIAWADADEDEVWVAERDATGAIVGRREVAQYRIGDGLTVVGQASIVADAGGSAILWVERDISGGAFADYSLRYVAWNTMDVETERLRFGPTSFFRTTEVKPRLFTVGGTRIAAYATLSTDALPVHRLVFRTFGVGGGVIYTTESGESDGVCVDDTRIYSVWDSGGANLRILDTDGTLIESGLALQTPATSGTLRCTMTRSGLMLAAGRTVWRVDAFGSFVGSPLSVAQRVQTLARGNGEVLAVGGGSTLNTEVYRLREDASLLSTQVFGLRSSKSHPEGAAYGNDWTLAWQDLRGLDDAAAWASLCD